VLKNSRVSIIIQYYLIAVAGCIVILYNIPLATACREPAGGFPERVPGGDRLYTLTSYLDNKEIMYERVKRCKIVKVVVWFVGWGKLGITSI
jgi:hypothetical protein